MDPLEREDYLYDSEVIRSDFIEQKPETEEEFILGGFFVHVTTWEIVFKGDDLYDYWHLLVDRDDSYNFEDPAAKAAVSLFKPYYVDPLVPELISLNAVVHVHKRLVLVYRVRKALSEVLDRHLPFILKGYTDGKFHYAVPAEDLGIVATPSQKEGST